MHALWNRERYIYSFERDELWGASSDPMHKMQVHEMDKPFKAYYVERCGKEWKNVIKDCFFIMTPGTSVWEILSNALKSEVQALLMKPVSKSTECESCNCS